MTAGHEESRRFARGTDHRQCQCGGELCHGCCYICDRCGRSVPWCFGADDEAPDYCDECWEVTW